MIFCKVCHQKVRNPIERVVSTSVSVCWFIEIHQYLFSSVHTIFVYCCKSASRIKSCLSDKYLYDCFLLLFIQVGFAVFFRLFYHRPFVSLRDFQGEFKTRVTTRYLAKCQIVRAATQLEVSTRILAGFELKLGTGSA